MKSLPLSAILSLALALATAASAQIPINGQLDPAYGQPRAVQSNPTGYGDNTNADPLAANGSELDAAHAVIRDGKLHLLLTGNLETNFNKLNIFIDSRPGGQNTLAGDNPDVDFNGLNNLAGLTFDTGFEADFFLSIGGGGAPVEFFGHYAELGDPGVGIDLGGTGSPNAGFPVTLADGVQVGIDNSNTGGVTDTGGQGDSVTTGIEFSIPLSLIGNPTGPVKISAFITDPDYNNVSNQVLSGLASGTANPGSAATVDFSILPGNQFFSSPRYEVIAGWDNWVDIGARTYNATDLNGATGQAVGTAPSGFGWGNWNNATFVNGASADGTWGTSTEPGADTSATAATSAVGLLNATASGNMNFTVTNTGGVPRLLNKFHFDGTETLAKAAGEWTLSIAEGSHVSIGQVASGTLGIARPMPAGGFDIDLAALDDKRLEPGEAVIFELAFTGGAGDASGGHNAMIDNVAVTAFLTLQVTNTADTGPGSLRQTIIDAPSGSLITFDPALSGQTITLTSGQMLLAKDLSIDASSLTGGLTVSAGNSSRVIEVTPGTTAILNNLILRDGLTPDGAFGSDGKNGGGIYNAGELTLVDCEISHNATGKGGDHQSSSSASAAHGGEGGGIHNTASGVLSLIRCTVSKNTTGTGGDADGLGTADNVSGGGGGNGAGICNYGILTLLDCFLTDNHCGDGGTAANGSGSAIPYEGRGGEGGGIRSNGNSAHLVVENSTVANNSTGQEPGGGDSKAGGGLSIASDGPATILNSTIANNSNPGPGTFYGGGGIAIFGTPTTIRNSTISGNSTGGDGGGIFVFFTGTLTVENSIVADNSSNGTDPDISGTVASTAGINLIGDASGASGLGTVGVDYLTGSPSLAPLGNYGGSTPTMHPLPGSPAIDAAGATDPGGTDQRGFPRFVGGALDIGAVESGSAIYGFVVTTATDENDGLAAGDVSLRDALAFLPRGSSVVFDPAVFNGEPADTITLAHGQLLISKHVQIDASNLPSAVVIDGNNASRIFEIPSGQDAHFINLHLTGGNGAGLTGSGNGGAIYNAGNLLLEDCALASNIVPVGKLGGGLMTTGTGSSATALRCLFSANETSGGSSGGGGIYANSSSTLSCIDSSFTGNLSANTGGAIHVFGAEADIAGSTFNDNGGPSCGDAGAVRATNAAVTITNSTFSGNNALNNGGALFVTGSSSVDVSHCTITGNTAGNGGGIRNNGGTLTLGYTIVAGNTATTTGPDINRSATLTVSGPCVIGINDTVTTEFPAGVPNGGGSFVGTTGTPVDPLIGPLADYGGPTLTMRPLPGSPVLDAATGSALATDQRGLVRPNGVAPDIGAVEALLALTVANTDDSGPDSLRQAIADAEPGATITFDPSLDGGTIALTGGQLVVDRTLKIDATGFAALLEISGENSSRIFDVAPGGHLELCGLHLTEGFALENGGAIRNKGSLVVKNCLLDYNGATNNGGAVDVEPGASAEFIDSTFVHNSAEVGGGLSVAGGTSVTNCTIAFNEASDVGGGIHNFETTVTINHGSITGNSATFNPALNSNSGTYLIDNSIVADNGGGDFFGPSTGTGNLFAGDPQLAPLGNYGGPTPTMPPLPGSPAIEGGILLGSTPLPDQRGEPRPNGPLPDIGAVEAYPLSLLDLADTDNDGIFDLFEGPGGPYPQLTVGTDDSGLDSDGDGKTDAEELAAMTDPLDAVDFFRILSFTKAAGFDAGTNPVFELTVKTFPGVIYRLERQNDPGQPFQGLPGGVFTADDSSETFQVELMPGRDFIRARVLPDLPLELPPTRE